MTGVLLIGDKPKWYNGEHIQMADVDRKEYSIMLKIKSCPYEDFLFSNDDIFALQDFDHTIPNYYSSTLAAATVYGKYVQRRDNCLTVYPKGLFYDIHAPMVVNRDQYAVANNVDWDKRDYLCKSLYGNYIGVGELLPDCKLRKSGPVPDVPFFSTSNYTSRLIPLQNMYPDASEYENDKL